MSQEQILYQGAEAVISLKGDTVKKNRIKKSYRIPDIDEKLRKQRTKSEARIIEKLKGKINVPKIIGLDEKNKEISMEFIKGKKLSEHLDNFNLKRQEEICEIMGEETGKLHDLDIIHGDLTTSNMILADNKNNNKSPHYQTDKNISINNKNSSESKRTELASEESESNLKIFFIDFGLGFHSKRNEDKAVDLHLLKQALEAKHFTHWEKLFNSVLKGYKKSRHNEAVLNQLKIVESRGRYKH